MHTTTTRYLAVVFGLGATLRFRITITGRSVAPPTESSQYRSFGNLKYGQPRGIVRSCAELGDVRTFDDLSLLVNPRSSAEFAFDRVNRRVTVSLPPNQGLLITRGGDYDPAPSSSTDFIITEIRIAGSNGEMTLKGNAVRKAFVVVSKPFYSFGPPTLRKLTYT